MRACVRSDFSMLLTTQFIGQGARCGTDFDEIIVPNEKVNHVSNCVRIGSSCLEEQAWRV